MSFSFWKSVILLGTVLFQTLQAQQFSGETIPNSLPSVPGSEIAFWKIKDPAGTSTKLTLTNYWSRQLDGSRLVTSNVKRAVIVIHGLNRDPGTYMSNMLSALSQVTSDTNINRSTVQIIAPDFANGDDKNISYPYYQYSGKGAKYSGGKQSNTSALVWQGSGWISGKPNQYPVGSVNTSSYDCIDQILQYFDNKALYPNLKQIVLVGHSAGAQTVNRYAAVSKSLGLTAPVTYWIGNPNSLLWLNSSRPFDTTSCPTYNDWRDGLDDYVDQGMQYNTALVSQGPAAVAANFLARNKAYARGTQDLGDDSSDCDPFTTGINRNERFFQFIGWWPATCPAPNSTTGHCDTIDLVDMGHDFGGMATSQAGLARLFIDNFYGDGARSYDFGHPRVQTGDDPYPDPAYKSATALSQNVYAGNMSFQGCYTDSGTRSLLNMAYENSTNTVEICTATCLSSGYALAGVEYGSQCWCDNYISGTASRVLDSGCTQVCAGNSSEICGGSNRISLYSASSPVTRPSPSNPETAHGDDYYYANCYSEATGARALSATSYTDTSNMTIDNCATFCYGYKYFGIEYAQECYCGSYLNSGSSIISSSSCSMVCTGASLELCGGSYALSVYQLSSSSDAKVITQGSGSTASTPTTADSNTASSVPSASLCPSADGSTITDSNGMTYQVTCSSDSSVNSYGASYATVSYLDCMSLCDADAGGCTAFTYVGATNGNGAGTCWMKTSQGSMVAQGSSYISAVQKSANGASSSSSTSSSSASKVSSSIGFSSSSSSTSSSVAVTASSSATSSTDNLCPSADGKTITDSQSIAYTVHCSSDSSVNSYGAVYPSSSYLDCMTMCDSDASTQGCQAYTYVGAVNGNGAGTCWLKTSLGSLVSQGNNYITVVRASSGSSSSSSSSSFSSSSSSSSSSLVTSVQSGSSSSSSTVSATGSTTSTAATLCPAADGKTITDARNVAYTVHCSSDSSVNSYGAVYPSSSYLECMTMCDTDTQGCQAFTYVGAVNGDGAGTCWLKTSVGSLVSQGNNYITVVRASSGTSGSSSSSGSSGLASSSSTSAKSGSSSSSPTTSTASSSTSTAATSSASSSLCPSVDGQAFADSNNVKYVVYCSSDSTVDSYGLAQVSGTYLDCMTACDADSQCNAFTYVGAAYGNGGGACWLKTALGTRFSQGSNYISAVKKDIDSSGSSSAASKSSSTSKSSGAGSSIASYSSTSTAKASTSPTAISCPSSDSYTYTTSNNDTFVVECGVDRNGGDMGSVTVKSMEACIEACATTSGCVDVSLSGVACYMKNSLVSKTSNSGVTGARLAPSPSSTSSSSSSSSLPTSSLSSATSVFLSSVVTSTSSAVVSSSSTTKVSTTLQTSTVSSTTTSSTSKTTSALPTAVLTSQYTALGCFVDTTRPLSVSNGSTTTNTPQKCAANCRGLGYRYSGTEYGQECWCGDTLPTTNTTINDCNMACTGDKTQVCGAGNRLSVVVDNNWVQKFFARSSYGAWNLTNCYTDSTSSRLLSTTVSTPGGSSNMTIANCMDSCAKAGFAYCGAEYYGECYGGNTTPSSSRIATGTDPLAAGCNYPCNGNSTEACGGSSKILVYVRN